jgi:hypothetical protein
MRKKKIVLMITLLAILSVSLNVLTIRAPPGGRKESTGVVYVASQGLYYDTFVSSTKIRYNGHNANSFQLLADGSTEFGPGDKGYKGGRWWIDDGDGIIEMEDNFVLCPLLGPGRESP